MPVRLGPEGHTTALGLPPEEGGYANDPVLGLVDNLGIEGGMLVANPVLYADEIPREEMETFIQTALKAADEQAVTAKAVTPFLLDHIFHQTSGRSLKTNIALVENNARLAAEIALALKA